MPLTDAQSRRTKATVKAVRLYDGDGMYLHKGAVLAIRLSLPGHP